MRRRWSTTQPIVLLLINSLLLVGCGRSQATPPQDAPPRLRITNSSPFTLDHVIIMFPQERITFGPVPAGATTDYQPVRNGVYRYAAYEITFGKRTIHQPVIDWISEEPLPGTAFTYNLSIDPQRDPWSMIQSEVRQE